MDSQTLQTIIVALVVAAAALFMGVRVLRSVNAARAKKKGGGCGGDCCS
jgi:hypothetical protein